MEVWFRRNRDYAAPGTIRVEHDNIRVKHDKKFDEDCFRIYIYSIEQRGYFVHRIITTIRFRKVQQQ